MSIATEADRQIAGGVGLAPGHAPGTPDLNKLSSSRGISAAASAVRYSRMRSPRRGAERLTIVADPNAAGFYERNGAERIGEAPSDAAPRRPLRC